MSLQAGEVFAGYTVVRLLGSGGMGEVYLARHPRLPRQDALKVLPTAVSNDAEFRSRLEREADMAATLWHPHIVGVHDRGEFDGQLWISMDYVDGTDAAKVLRERHPTGMPPMDVVEIITAIADALDHAHDRQLLHRDVKPANILVTESVRRRILLADFGIARHADDVNGLTATNMTVGSVSYTAPEQLMAEAVDGRADQYGLAATTYHLLTGASPFSHANAAVVISRHLSAPPPDIGDSRAELAALGSVIARAMAKNPADRYATCLAFAEALREGVVAGGAVAAAPPSPPPQPTVQFATPAAVRPAAPPVYVSSWSDTPEGSPPQRSPRPRPTRRTEAEFWIDVGVDPIKIVFELRTVYSLRCYVDGRPYFLGRRRRLMAFETKTELLDYVGSATDHDLVELTTFPTIAAAARRRARRITVASKNAYSFAGLRAGIERGRAIDAAQLELAVELALDLADYTGDEAITRMFEPGTPLDRLVRHVVFGEGPAPGDAARRHAASLWGVLEDRLGEHL